MKAQRTGDHRFTMSQPGLFAQSPKSCLSASVGWMTATRVGGAILNLGARNALALECLQNTFADEVASLFVPGQEARNATADRAESSDL